MTNMEGVVYPDFRPEYSGVGLMLKIKKDPLHYFHNLGVKNGSFTWLKLMGSPVLFLNDATAIEYIFAENYQNYHKGKYNDGLRPLLGYSVFLSEDELWAKQRRDVAPNFSGGHFPEYAKRISEAADAMIRRWEPRIAKGELIDIASETMKLALDVVLRALYHEDSQEALQQLQVALGTMLRFAEQRIWSVVNLPIPVALKLPRYAKTMTFLNELTHQFIEMRRENKKYPEDLLSRLIETHGDTPLERKLLRDGVLSFLLAGYETTANGLAWTIYELGRHSEVRLRVIDEIDRLAGDGEVTMDIVKKMNYTRQAFFEGLRVYPPIWTTSRCALKDDIVPLDDGRKLFVPKGATLMLCTYSTHRREDYWSDPESFNPERFTPEEIQKRPKCAWFPFGGGPRLCLGFKFAEVESLIALAKIYRTYDLKLVPGQKINPEPIITLRADHPMWFRVHRRSR